VLGVGRKICRARRVAGWKCPAAGSRGSSDLIEKGYESRLHVVDVVGGGGDLVLLDVADCGEPTLTLILSSPGPASGTGTSAVVTMGGTRSSMVGRNLMNKGHEGRFRAVNAVGWGGSGLDAAWHTATSLQYYPC